MANREQGFSIVKAPHVDPRSPDGLELFASLLQDQAPAHELETFEVSWDPGEGHSRHRHNTGLAVAVTHGSVTFLFGSRGEREEEAREGDFVWIAAGTWHDEKTASGVEMIGAHIGPLETYDDE